MYLSKRKKTGVYYLYFRKEDGKKTRMSTKTTIKSEALKFLSQFESKFKAKPVVNEILLKDFAAQYIKTIYITHTRESYQLTKRLINNFVASIGNDVKLKDVSQSICESYILKTYTTAKHHAHLQLRHLKAFFNKAIQSNQLEKNPLRSMKLRVPENHPVFISIAELEKILKKEKDLGFRQIYEFAFYTGLRISEVVNLEWTDINFANRELKVQNKEEFTTKSKRERMIPMNEKVYSLLLKVKQKSRWVFTVRLKKIEKSYLSKRFKGCVRDAKLNEGIHFHSLRHSFASTLVQRGVNLYFVQKLLGHSQISTTQRYSHLRNEDLVQAINQLN